MRIFQHRSKITEWMGVIFQHRSRMRMMRIFRAKSFRMFRANAKIRVTFLCSSTNQNVIGFWFIFISTIICIRKLASKTLSFCGSLHDLVIQKVLSEFDGTTLVSTIQSNVANSPLPFRVSCSPTYSSLTDSQLIRRSPPGSSLLEVLSCRALFFVCSSASYAAPLSFLSSAPRRGREPCLCWTVEVIRSPRSNSSPGYSDRPTHPWRPPRTSRRCTSSSKMKMKMNQSQKDAASFCVELRVLFDVVVRAALDVVCAAFIVVSWPSLI